MTIVRVSSQRPYDVIRVANTGFHPRRCHSSAWHWNPDFNCYTCK